MFGGGIGQKGATPIGDSCVSGYDHGDHEWTSHTQEKDPTAAPWVWMM